MKDYNKLVCRGEECATKFNSITACKTAYAMVLWNWVNIQLHFEELKKAEILAVTIRTYVQVT